MKKFLIIATSFFLFGLSAHGATKTEASDLDSLADNDALVEKSRLIAPAKKIESVQGRMVDLNSRLELGLSYGPTFGGEAYLNTQNLGASLDYHIVPRFSIGARYYHSYNQLSSVGTDAFNSAQYASAGGSTNYKIPAIDYPMDSYLGVANYSLTYGKINVFDAHIVQFDVYVLGGAGEIVMSSGPTATYTAGGGMAFWWNQHLSLRIEGRYQTYTETTFIGSQRLDLGAMTFGIGMLL